MSGEEKRRRPAPSATPWDGAGDGELSPAERIVRDCHRDMYRYRHAGAGLVGEADFFNGYDRDACPRCGSPAIEGNGRDANGVRRWRCLSCGRAINPATGTVFDGRKLPVADWTEFLLEVFSYGSLAGAARAGRRSATTPPYWLAKLLAVLEGVQEGAVLAGRVEIDEMMYPLPLADQPRMPDGSKVLPPMYFPPFTPMIHNRSRQPAPAGYANVFPPLSAPPPNLSRNARASRARALSEPG